MRGLGDMSSDVRTEGHDGDYICSPEIFWEHNNVVSTNTINISVDIGQV